MTPSDEVLEKSRVGEPPLAAKVRYRLGWSISEDYRAWVERDIRSRSFMWWQLLNIGLGLLAALGVLSLLFPSHDPRPSLLGLAIGSLAALVMFRDFTRRRFLGYHEKKWSKVQGPGYAPDFRRFP